MIRKAFGAIIFHGSGFLLVHKVKVRSLRDVDEIFIDDGIYQKGGVEGGDNDLKMVFNQAFTNKTGYKKQETTMFIVVYVGD